VIFHDTVNRTSFRKQQKPSKKLLTLLESGPVEHDRFGSHLRGGSIGEYAKVAGKSGKQIKRSVISTFQPRIWALRPTFVNGRDLLRIGD